MQAGVVVQRTQIADSHRQNNAVKTALLMKHKITKLKIPKKTQIFRKHNTEMWT